MWLKFSESGSLTSSDLVWLATPNRPITSLPVSSVFCVLRDLAFHLMKQSQSMLPLPSFLASTARVQKSKGVDTIVAFTYSLQMPTQMSTVPFWKQCHDESKSQLPCNLTLSEAWCKHCKQCLLFLHLSALQMSFSELASASSLAQPSQKQILQQSQSCIRRCKAAYIILRRAWT